MRKKIYLVVLLLFAGQMLMAAGFTVSGIIPYAANTTVTLSGDADRVTVTDNQGYYQFTDLPAGGNYIVTPSKAYTPPGIKLQNPLNPVMGDTEVRSIVTTDVCAYAFMPENRSVSNLNGDLQIEDFQMLLTDCCFGINRVDYSIDGKLLFSDTSYGMCYKQYSWKWDTTGSSNGLHVLTITAVDNNGGTGMIKQLITVNNSTLLGDANVSGQVDIVDALTVAQYYVSQGIMASAFDQVTADVNASGKTDIVDALMIAQYYVGLLPMLPVPMPGGYSQTDRSSDSVILAYNFFKSWLQTEHPELTLGDVKLAFSQVVAGHNIKMICYYQETIPGGPDKFLSATVYITLDMIPSSVTELRLDLY